MRDAPPFTAATAVEPAGDGRWSGRLIPPWRAVFGPHGGVITAVGLRALEHEVGDPLMRIRSATATFPSVAQTEHVEIDTSIIRSGKAVSQVRGTVRDAGSAEPKLDVVATFGLSREGTTGILDTKMPDVPPPDVCPREPTPFGSGQDGPIPEVFRRLDRRRARGYLPWDPQWSAGGSTRILRWNRFVDGARRDDGTLDPLSLAVLGDLPGPSFWTRFGPDDFHAMASLEMSMRFLADAEVDWVLGDYHTAWAGDGYGSTEAWLWGEDGTLLAFVNQLVFLRKVPPPWLLDS